MLFYLPIIPSFCIVLNILCIVGPKQLQRLINKLRKIFNEKIYNVTTRTSNWLQLNERNFDRKIHEIVHVSYFEVPMFLYLYEIID